MIIGNPGSWEAEPSDSGGQVVRHRYGDGLAVCYLYSNPDRVWAECTMCGADLDLQMPASGVDAAFRPR